jgi:hypothetical protein
MLTLFGQCCLYLACCGSVEAAMLSIMTIRPKTVADGHANICVQDNKKPNPIGQAGNSAPVLSQIG